MFKTYLKRNFHIISNKIYYAIGIRKNVVKMALDKTVITEYWKLFPKKLF